MGREAVQQAKDHRVAGRLNEASDPGRVFTQFSCFSCGCLALFSYTYVARVIGDRNEVCCF